MVFFKKFAIINNIQKYGKNIIMVYFVNNDIM